MGWPATTVAAWWGAVVATLVLLWDAYKWRRGGARLRVVARPNMDIIGSMYASPESLKGYIIVTATNVGGQQTTITHLLLEAYPSLWARLRGKYSGAGVMPLPSFGTPPPFTVEPGKEWQAGFRQSEVSPEWRGNTYLYIGVGHTMARRSVMCRLRTDQIDWSLGAPSGPEGGQ